MCRGKVMEDKKIEVTLSIIAVVISAIALYLSIESNKAAITHNELSVTPILQSGYLTSPSSQQKLNFRIKNVGLGPAIIKSAEISYMGEKLSPIDSVKLKQFLPDLGTDLYTRGISEGQVIPQGETYIIIEDTMNREVSVQATWKSRDFFENMCFVITYESVYKREAKLVTSGCAGT